MSRKTHSVEELEIMAYLDGELSRGRAAALALHLEQCEECQRLAEGLRSVSKELAGWPVESPELEITPQIAVALDEHERAEKDRPRRKQSGFKGLWRSHRWWAWGLTSAFVVLLVMAVSIPNLMRSSFLAEKAASEARKRQQNAVSVGLVDQDVTRSSGYTSSGLLGKLQSDRSRSSTQDVNGNRTEREIPIPSGPMIVRTAEINLTATDFDHARASLEEILKRHDGYMGQLTVSGSADAARTLTAVLRVPSNQLDAALSEMKALGHVDAESQKGDEVTQQYVDLEARLKNSGNEEQRLIEILRQRTGKLSDVLAVEQEIASVREEIERMEAEKKTLEKQVAFSTVNMKINEDYKERVHVVPDSTSTRIRNAGVEGYEMMVAGLVNVLLFFASWGPSLLLWGLILFFPVRWLWRYWRKDLL
jgi:hypothetical protein